MSTPQPAKGPPQRLALEGRYTRLEPLGPQHVADLWRATVPERYRYLPSEAPANEAELAERVAAQAAEADRVWFAVVSRTTGTAEGQQALMHFVPEHGTIGIGGVYWGPRLARTRKATEALFLAARYVFDTLSYRRFEWKCNNRNDASRAAARRFGFKFEGVFLQHMIVKGQNRDTAWFAMLDGDWPAIKAEYERWLQPDNFDETGAQKTKLRV